MLTQLLWVFGERIFFRTESAKNLRANVSFSGVWWSVAGPEIHALHSPAVHLGVCAAQQTTETRKIQTS